MRWKGSVILDPSGLDINLSLPSLAIANCDDPCLQTETRYTQNDCVPSLVEIFWFIYHNLRILLSEQDKLIKDDINLRPTNQSIFKTKPFVSALSVWRPRNYSSLNIPSGFPE